MRSRFQAEPGLAGSRPWLMGPRSVCCCCPPEDRGHSCPPTSAHCVSAARDPLSTVLLRTRGQRASSAAEQAESQLGLEASPGICPMSYVRVALQTTSLLQWAMHELWFQRVAPGRHARCLDTCGRAPPLALALLSSAWREGSPAWLQCKPSHPPDPALCCSL